MTTKRQTPYAFFLKHAGYSYDPKMETPIEGRRRHARALAKAERRGLALGLYASWDQDLDPDAASFLKQDGYTAEDRASACFVSCQVVDERGAVLASLYGIHEDDRQTTTDLDNYRRVVRAELFLEALADLDARAGADEQAEQARRAEVALAIFGRLAVALACGRGTDEAVGRAVRSAVLDQDLGRLAVEHPVRPSGSAPAPYPATYSAEQAVERAKARAEGT